MKKALSLLLVFVLLFAAAPLTVNAYAILTVTGKSNYCPDIEAKDYLFGRQVELAFYAPENCDIINLQWSLKYDSSKLELTGISTIAPALMKVDVSGHDIFKGSVSLDPSFPYGVKKGEEFMRFVFYVIDGFTTQVELTIENMTVRADDGSSVEIFKDGVDMRSSTSPAVGGTVTSYLNSSDGVTLRLVKRNDSSTYFSKTVYGNNASFSFSNVPTGLYTLTVSKKNHVTRSYTVSAGSTALNLQINPLGDINGDGTVNVVDYARVNAHVRNVKLLSGYELQCADVVGNDGVIKVADAARINAHVRGVNKMW